MDNQMVVMSADEARKLVDDIRFGIVNVGRKLLELKERDGWRSLGYSTWRDCAQVEFGYRQSHVYRLLEAAEVERNISPVGENQMIPERQLRPLASLEPEQQREAWARVIETAQDGKVTAAHVQSVVDELYGDDEEEFDEEEFDREQILEANRQGASISVPPAMPHVSHNSGNNEWYTPAEYIEAARRVMGGIDLDPASSATANGVVMADRFYSADDDGLSHEWAGRVWMNPPYSSDLIWQFAAKLRKHYQAGDIQEAIVLVNNATETAWFYDMAQAASAIAFTHSRVKYLNEALEPKGAPLQGQALIYFGKNVKKFREAFEDLCWSAVL